MRASAAGRLEWVSSRLRAAVAARIASLNDAGTMSVGAGISPELAWDALHEADLATYAGRLARAAVLLDLDQPSLDVLWLCAAPELDDGIGLLFGFLLGDAAARLPTPRLVASLLAGDGVAPTRVLARLAADAPLRRRGCLQLVDTGGGVPLADQAVRLAPELAGFLLEAQLHQADFDPRLRRHEVPGHPVGRAGTLTRIRAALEARGAVPVVLAAPDAADVLAVALGTGLILIDAGAAGDADLLSRARLWAALEERVIAFGHDHLLALDAGARQASRSAIGDRARRLAPDCAWDELVLPERQLEQLRSIAAHLRHRDQVLTEWGFERAASGRLGLSVLFAGESGTGKTMAARVLAADLGLELFAVNLASVVSKFVGETEQNLERVFAAAEGSNAILLFDEADALFGRRSEVADASDRYANLEVTYLLQRIEAHTGAVILTTNLKQNLDVAFLRRLDFVVDFRFPDEDDRRRLWRTVIPAQAPVADDIDFDFLAERFTLSGGSIRNCSLAAAFEAASCVQPVRMAHIVRAIGTEYRKLGRLTVESDFGAYFAMLSDPDAQPAPDEAQPAPEAVAPPAVTAPPQHSEQVRVRARIEEL